MIICLNGIDGSGKSYQAQELVDRLNDVGYSAVYVWTGGRRTLRRPIIWLGQRLLKGKKLRRAGMRQREAVAEYTAYTSSKKRMFKNRLLRTVWLHVSLVEHMLEIWVAILPHLLRKRIVVCDRYLYDSILRSVLLSDQDIDSFRRLLGLLSLYRTPQPTVGFLIDVPAQVAFSRKDDIPTLEFLERRIPLYETLSAKYNFHRIDGTKPPEAVGATIWQQVQQYLPRTRTGAATSVEADASRRGSARERIRTDEG